MFNRHVLPKGTSFDDLTQEKVSLMMNHQNSYKRKKLGDKSPYEMFELIYGATILEQLGAKFISPDKIKTNQPASLINHITKQEGGI